MRKVCFKNSILRIVAVFFSLSFVQPAFAQDTSQTQKAEQKSKKEFKSGYENIPVTGGSTSVAAELVNGDVVKQPLVHFHLLCKALRPYYRFKEGLNRKHGIALSTDYIFLNQFATFSFEDRQAASGSFRMYGTWKVFGSADKTAGSLVFRFENRHRIGPGLTPRELGFSTGSALSTASFKEFGWGITSLYWQQLILNKRFALVFGQMDPGDFEDLHPLLNAWTAFQNDAYFNNPTTALPQQGLGVVLRTFLSDQVYLEGGLHDAKGTPNKIGFDTFFKTREYFTWIEAGFSPGGVEEAAGQSIHLTYWHQDPRAEAGTAESWGAAFSASLKVKNRWIPFIRAGYSEGGAALMRWIVGAGVGIRLRGHDLLGLASSIGGTEDASQRNQITSELFYRLQFTDNLELTPGLQWTINPAMNLEKDFIAVAAVLRLRLVV